MPASKLKEFLDSRGIKYVSIRHSPAFAAAEVAASAHISGRNFAVAGKSHPRRSARRS